MGREFRVLSLPHDREEWSALLAGLPQADICFTPQYCEVFSGGYGRDVDEAFCGQPALLYYGDGDGYVVQPFLKRRLDDLSFCSGQLAESYFDLVSPYGYAGPLVRWTGDGEPTALISGFLMESSTYSRHGNIVSEFVRFHPFLENHRWIQPHHPVEPRSLVVFADLTVGGEGPLVQMDKKTRSLVRKGQRCGVRIIRSERMAELETFIGLYVKTMHRVRARPEYHFPRLFFDRLVTLLGGHVTLFLAEYAGTIVAASLFVQYGRFFHYFLSGSDSASWHVAPNNLLLWEAGRWARSRALEVFDLGGGYSGRDDGLLRFKGGFSRQTRRFYSMSRVHLDSVYRQLVTLKARYELETEGRVRDTPGFFPQYRR